MIPTVLSVDDDPSSHILMRAFLEDEEFCDHFISATSPGQGLEILRGLDADPHSSLPALIICDVHMPEMSGWEFISRAAPILGNAEKDKGGKGVTVIMLTATTTSEDEALVESNPLISRLFKKPLTLKLLEQIRAMEGIRDYFKTPAGQSCS